MVIWGTKDYNVLTSSFTKDPIHDLCWDPFTMNEFVSVGENGNVLFWLLDETRGTYNLNVRRDIWKFQSVVTECGFQSLVTECGFQSLVTKSSFQSSVTENNFQSLVTGSSF